MSTPRTPNMPASNIPHGVPTSPLQPQAGQALLQELQSEVSTEAAPLLQFIVTHVKSIVTFFVLFLVVLVGFGAYNWYTTKTLQTAQDDLARIMLTSQGTERINKLEAFLVDAPKGMQSATLLAAADAATEAQDYVAAAKFFGTLAQAEPDKATGLLAALNEGQALLLAGKPTEALAVLDALQNKMPEQSRTLVSEAVVEAALLANDTEKAYLTLESLAENMGGSTADFFRYRAHAIKDTAAQKAQ